MTDFLCVGRMKIVVVVVLSLLCMTASADKIFPWFGCFMHMKSESSMGVSAEEHVMQNVDQGGHSYYLFQNNTKQGTTYYVNCEYQMGGKCLHITRNGKTCEEKYEYDPPVKEDLVFYFDSKESTKCPYITQTGCLKYCNSTTDSCVVIDSKNREVELVMSILTVDIEYLDDPFTPEVFANSFCDGTPIKPPSNFCSKHKH